MKCFSYWHQEWYLGVAQLDLEILRYFEVSWEPSQYPGCLGPLLGFSEPLYDWAAEGVLPGVLCSHAVGDTDVCRSGLCRWLMMWSHSIVSDTCDPVDCSSPGFYVRGLLQASMLEWAVIVRLLSCMWLFATPQTAARQAACPLPAPGACSNSCPLSRWCRPTISSVIPFSSCLRSFPASGSFQMSQLFTSGGQSIRASASSLVLPMNIQDWLPLGWTGWISLQAKGISRVISNTTVWRHQFFSIQPSLWSNSHIHTWPLAKP